MAKISRPIVRIHDLATDEVVDREMNDEEFAIWELQQTANAQAEAEAQAREAARQATIAKLAALGLTPEDLAVL